MTNKLLLCLLVFVVNHEQLYSMDNNAMIKDKKITRVAEFQGRYPGKVTAGVLFDTPCASDDSHSLEESSESTEDAVAYQKNTVRDDVFIYQAACDSRARQELAAAQAEGRVANMLPGTSQSYLIAAYRHNQTIDNN